MNSIIPQRLLGCLLCLVFVSLLPAQTPATYPYNGVYDQRDGHYAFTNANITSAPGQNIASGTLVIKNGKVVSVTNGRNVPAGAVEIDLSGKFVYPAFVEAYGSYGLPEAKSAGKSPDRQPQMLSNKKGAYGWNEALKPEFDAVDHFTVNSKAAGEWRKLGFGTVNSHQMDGIHRGSSVAVSLAESKENSVILANKVAAFLSYSKGKSTQDYPSSRMGSIALLRQTYIDADWYRNQADEKNLSLEAWNELAKLPQFFEVGDWQNLLRAQRIADEFDLEYIYQSGGDEYRRLDAIKATGAALILPLNFPDAYDVSDPYGARLVSLEDLRHWERAPGNPAAVADAGITFALTTHGLKKKSEFMGMLRKAIKAGLSEEAALRALTKTPAKMLGLQEQVGELKKGSQASFLVTSAPVFDKDASILQNWCQGERFELKPLETAALAGTYQLTVDGKSMTLEVKGKAGKEKFKLPGKDEDDKGTDVKHKVSGEFLSLSYQTEGSPGFVRLNGGKTNNGYAGRGQDANGNWVDWSMRKTGEVSDEKKEDKKEKEEDKPARLVSQLTMPLGGYGFATLPASEKILIRNATVWTSEEDGILEETDVMVENGKISAIGKNLPKAGARVIDGAGKHLTAGIIDEHSHIALSSVNEGSQASSAEVRMTDVIDATDVDIYRQLAGGVTTSQLLHGSANPIGGQSAIVKLRWGASPEEMIFDTAPGFIKFALGENVKQSNWGDDYRIRFPQTRMGVEQVFDSYFTRAREYEKAKNAGGKGFRRDLELEALLEILNEERFITCHSYQQGEINMLMGVGERHDFVVNTFTHILEGYKVADKMVEHGAGGSTFSDWWAYKYEVNEAIPFNAALMHEQGVTVAINSDDAEMARRLNQEAGKMVLFGGVSEEEALKFVTLNPAKLMHIDDRVGSIKVGKDADLVVWSDHPLSIYARAENTLVDGKEYYSMEKDKMLRQRIQEERNALIQKSLDAKADGSKTQKPKGKQKRYLHCDSLEHEEGEHDH
ncbi:amidohydrolase [Lewinellaceae bacterium SD302]|nr:amidohydrolase [Lewinellaceae bacterium SD302]